MKKVIKAADLFAGAGGASGGLVRACEKLGRPLDLLAVNHWQTAVETHTANYPNARHLCEDLESVNPRKAVPGGRLDLLLAAPECTHFATARGGKPMNDQSRASAWCILRWATALQIDTILIENVREFQTWGPLGSTGRPLKSRKGETFHAFIDSLKSLGYRVDWRVLNAADYGDPTTRQRLFIQARRGRRPITWPEPTHAAGGDKDMFGERQKWRAAREIIDWAIPSESIFRRKKPLSPNTIARIAAGLQKFGGAAAQPFLVVLRNNCGSRSLEKPLPTVCASGEHAGLCEPFILGQQSGSVPRGTDQPLPTVATDGAIGLCQPFIVPYRGERDGQEPRAHSVDQPMPVVSTVQGHGLVEPFIISMEHSGANGSQVRPVTAPLPTITSRGDFRVVEPFIAPVNHGATKDGGKRAYPLDRPMPTITTVDAWGLIEPFLTRYNNNRAEVCARDINAPMPAIDCNDRYALVTVDGVALDIRFRMLQPHELAAAMSFPKGYQFKGNREQRVRQIGNAWAGCLSQALCEALLAS